MMANLRGKNGLSWERFGSYHAGCGIETVDLLTTNSDKADSVTSDLKPKFRQQLHCGIHKVSSIIKETLGR